MKLDMCVFISKTKEDDNKNTIISDKLFNFLNLEEAIENIKGPGLLFFEYTIDSNE